MFQDEGGGIDPTNETARQDALRISSRTIGYLIAGKIEDDLDTPFWDDHFTAIIRYCISLPSQENSVRGKPLVVYKK